VVLNTGREPGKSTADLSVVTIAKMKGTHNFLYKRKIRLADMDTLESSYSIVVALGG
jgi:hypothetical protein